MWRWEPWEEQHLPSAEEGWSHFSPEIRVDATVPEPDSKSKLNEDDTQLKQGYLSSEGKNET
jgi:hypothetical protein